MFLHNPRAYEQGQICICGFMSKICLCFVKSSGVSKNHTNAVNKPENNRFRVSMYFATNLFTLPKIPPPPPLLHPRYCSPMVHWDCNRCNKTSKLKELLKNQTAECSWVRILLYTLHTAKWWQKREWALRQPLCLNPCMIIKITRMVWNVCACIRELCVSAVF